MTSSSLVKYQVKLKFKVEGVVERADIIGAIFGQTEGLFGPELNLNELQKGGKVGRIEVNMKSEKDQSYGEVIVPMSTDISTAALIAAAIESVDKVGPCDAKFKLVSIEDVRAAKKRQIVERAKEILKEWASRAESESDRAIQELLESIKRQKVISYGKENLPAGSGIFSSDTIYVVEGRADVVNLLRAGIDNVIALNGVKVPETIIKLGKEKKLIAFLDGDRGGDLIQKELDQVVKLEGVIRAPEGKEVEDLEPTEILRLVREFKKAGLPDKTLHKVKEAYEKVNGTLEALILDKEGNELRRVPISELIPTLGEVDEPDSVIFDGIITQRLLDLASERGVKLLVAHRIGQVKGWKKGMTVTTFKRLGLE
ncbi:MAG: DNA primase [Thaumarchaeota archaeon]|nr:DNA primase [Nitrososphaerota archaeon]